MKRLIERFIATYGDKYKQKYLISEDKEKLCSDWLEALRFFFDRSFMGGRVDVVSAKFKKRALTVVESWKNTLEKCWNLGVNWDKKRLKGDLSRRKVNKGLDRDMVIQTLEFISRKRNYNIVLHSLNKIRNQETKELFGELNLIANVAEKKAALFIRDLVDLFGLEESISEDAFIYLQPIDTWVHQVCRRHLRILTSENPSWKEDAPKIVKHCLSLEISPVKFNQGAWYIGTHSLEILFEILQEKN